MAEDFGQGDHYASDLDGLVGFTNDDVSTLYKTYEEAYDGKNVMLDMDEYVNNAYNSEAAADSYDTYIRADLYFPDANGNAVYGCVKKRVCNDYGQAVDVINQRC